MSSTADILRTLAWYNERANAALGEILSREPRLVAEPGTTYYGSILTMLSHLVISDTVWLRRTWPGDERPAELGIEFTSVADELFADLARWSAHRRRLDALIRELCGALAQPEYDEEVRYTNTKGAPFVSPRWQLLLHMFNHQTHHRGGIAQLLDERGVANDVSNLVWYLREPEATA